jgi:EmrB/QacA subfamily drug resistance transporter
MYKMRERHRTASNQTMEDKNVGHDAALRSERGAVVDEQHRPWGLLVLLCIPQFMVILDATIVNVALPSIGRELRFAASDLQWVVSAYVLMTGGLMLLGGRSADLLGRRPVLLTGLAVFTAASLASGLAPTPGALIASRIGQGLGAALLSPAALSIITTTYTGSQRATALSTWGALAGGGGAAGVLLGGMITTWLGWRYIFFINVPVGLIAGLLALRMVPTATASLASLRGLDLTGALTLVAGLSLLVYGIRTAGTRGWGSVWTLALFALAAGLLSAFAALERAAAQPLIPPATWRVRSLVSSSAVMLGVTGVLVGTFFMGSLFLQNVLRTSALQTGLYFLPLVFVTGIAAHAGRELLGRVGARAVVVGGLVLIACGDLLLSGAGVHANYATDVLPGFALIGFGVGLTFVAVSVTAMSEIAPERAGLASGLMTTGHELGAAFGVAVFSAVALGSGAGSFVAGYGEAALAGALIAAVLALVSLVAVPSFRPTNMEAVTVH